MGKRRKKFRIRNLGFYRYSFNNLKGSTMTENYDEFDNIFDDDIDLFDDNEKNDKTTSKKKNSSKNKISKFIKLSLIGALVVGLAGGGWYVVQNENAKSQQQEQASSEENQNIEIEGFDPNRPKTDETLQLVNTQQVFWADDMCNIASQWTDKEFPGKIDIEGKSTVWKNKKALISALETNAQELRNRSNSMLPMIDNVYNKAKEKEDNNTIITDNNKLIKSLDQNVIGSTYLIRDSINRYADSLDSMAKDLKKYSDYDEYGTRGAISRVQHGLDDAYQQFGTSLAGVFDDGIFENAVTLQAASQLESCSGALIDQDKLESKYGEEIKKQEKIAEFVNFNRCKAFIDNSSRITNKNESYNSSVNSCNSLLSTITMDGTHDGYYMNINTQDNDRARPSHDSFDEEDQETNTDSNNDENSEHSENKGDAKENSEKDQKDSNENN